jgi:pimeloyl-ACP methyl ester carboxylesterase
MLKFKIAVFIFTIAASMCLKVQELNVYLFPGQGSDYRIFDSLQLEKRYILHYMHYAEPNKKETLSNYSNAFSSKIDTTNPFILIGVSFGGMICAELTQKLNPTKTIIISSAKNKSEIPKRYRFMKKIPLYKLIPASVYKWSSFIVQPIFEPDRKKNKTTFKAMLRDKNPKFLKRATHMIVNWQLENYESEIYSIHGTKDHTLPLKQNNHTFIVEKGSHMMMLTQGTKISNLISQILSKSKD